MSHEEEKKIFNEYIRSKNLKYSEQRLQILEIFLKTEQHLTSDELYRLVRKKYPAIGYATIYRTLKLLCNSGVCRELRLDDGSIKYEHLYGHEHHDHLICTKCGRVVEIINPAIEKLQSEIAKAENFILEKHNLHMYGICGKCREV